MFKCNQKGFYDLNVHEACFKDANSKNTLQILFKFGYRTIAINQQVDVDSTDTKKKKKKGEPRGDNVDVVPSPFNIQELKDLASELKLHDMTFLNRLTLMFSNQDSLQKFIKSNNFKKYDIVAVIPTTSQAMTFVCTSLDADILSFNPENKHSIKLNRKMYFQLVTKGYHLELMYSPAIEDATKRKNLIHLSHIYHTFGKSRNIIFSSGAENFMLIRNPYDIISFGPIFGLSELESKNSVLHLSRNVIVNAIGRRHGKAVVMVENMESMDVDNPVVIDSDSDQDKDMETEEPVQKKPKQ